MTRERRLLIIGIVLLAGFVLVAFFGSRGNMNTLTEFLYLLAIAQLWNLLAGYAGLVSVGQQGWIGLGAYTLLVLVDDVGIPVILAVLLCGLLAAVVAYPTALLVFRLRGGYFAIGTWVVAETLRLLVTSSTEWLGGGLGRSFQVSNYLPNATQRIMLIYLLAVIIAFGVMLLVHLLMRSKTGLALTAIRDSEGASASLGINTNRIKMFIFIVCAYVTAVCGGLIAINQLNIIPAAMFSVNWTAFMIFIVVIGGIGTIEGPVIGTVIFFFIREYLSNFGPWSFIILGTIAIVMMLIAPQGIWGLVRERFNIEIFPIRRLIPEALLTSQESVS